MARAKTTNKPAKHQSPPDAAPADATTAPTAAAIVRTPRPKTKFAGVIALLVRESGATIAEIQELTGWQEHSVRGVLAGALKTRFGLTVTSQKTDGARIYRAAYSDQAAA